MFRNFRRMAMGEKAVSAKILIHLDELRIALWLLARTGYARFAIAYDSARLVDPACFDEGPQPQNH